MKHRAGKLCRTLAVFLLSMLVLSLLVFVIARLAPGDPLVSYYGERAEKMKPAERAQAEARLGLDQPIAQQYLIWLKGALRGEFGISYKYKMDVLAVIRARLPFTLQLGGIGFLLFFLRAVKRPDKDDDAGEQNADDDCRNDDAVAVEKSERIRFLRRVRCGGITACRERFAGIDDALIDNSQQLGLAARN